MPVTLWAMSVKAIACNASAGAEAPRSNVQQHIGRIGLSYALGGIR